MIVEHTRSRNPQMCLLANIFKAVVGQISMTCMEAILMVRRKFLSKRCSRVEIFMQVEYQQVFALYNRTRRVRYVLTTIFALGFVLEISGSILVIRTLRSSPLCDPQTSPTALAAFGSACF